MSENNVVADAIRTAISQELADRMNKQSQGYIMLSPKAFEIAVEPNSPLIALDISEGFQNAYADFAVNDVYDPIVAGFADECDNRKYKTFRRVQDKELPGTTMHAEIKADTWEDLIDGLNKVLSENNRIDRAILGKGK